MPGRHRPRQLALTSREGKARMVRARSAVIAIRRGADHELTLSYVVWPTFRVEQPDLKKAA